MAGEPRGDISDDPVGRAAELIEKGEFHAAAQLLRRVLIARRGGLLAELMLVRALIASGSQQAAIDQAREIALAHPHVAAAAVALGDAFFALDRLPMAIAEYQRALRLDPYFASARSGLARAWLEAGEPALALEALSKLTDEECAGRRELVDRGEKMAAALRSSPGYVRHLFDQFSQDYDRKMRSELSYAAPEILRELVSLIIPGASALSVLDLGCGTGLTGLVFRPLASRLDGLDLSPEMVAMARKRNVYDSVEIGDIEAMQARIGLIYDLVVAADTLVYLGDLSAVFASVASLVRDGGHFLFTVEKAAGHHFGLGPKRRWQHSEPYLKGEAERAGFEVVGMLDCVPRKEAGRPVDGLAVALEKKS